MAHQCLACGHLFTEGSSAILQGCPQCKGTRFFYTQKPLPAEERQALAAKAQKDLRSVVSELLQSAPEAQAEMQKVAAGGWGELRPKDLRKLVAQVAEQQERAQANAKAKMAEWENPDVQPFVVDAKVGERRDAMQAELAAKAKAPPHPDTVNIRKPGQYDIDIKGLLEKNPIVVHKDGAYLIHLPSLFDQAKRE